MTPKILRAALLVVACLTILSQSGANAQQIPGAPAQVFSLQWFTSAGTNISQYADAGFLYPSPAGGTSGTGPLGNYYVLADAGTTSLYTGTASPGSLGTLNLLVNVIGSASGTLQAQCSNDGTASSWTNIGTLLTMDGGAVQTYSLGGVGTQSVISPCACPLVRVLDSSTSTANSTIEVTAFPR